LTGSSRIERIGRITAFSVHQRFQTVNDRRRHPPDPVNPLRSGQS
jgi:hypothetical protein